MKKLIFTSILLLCLSGFNAQAQERFGRTLNLGVGAGGYGGYYSYVGHPLPVFNINFELDVARNFTLAPSISFYSYTEEHYWGNKNYPDRWYTHNVTVVPVGLKGTYYFDELLKA